MVRGLNALAATVTTPLLAPVIAATRLRGGNANTARGAASLIAEAIDASRQAGCTGIIVVRMDSGYYGAPACKAARRGGACFSVTARMDPRVKAAIASIGEDAWQPVSYPQAVWDEQERRLVSAAEVAGIGYTAVASKKGQAITARLIVRRVRRLGDAPAGQGELFAAYRYHAVLTDSPFELIQAEGQHRAVVEQVFADLFDGPLAHLPSVISFPANAAWLTLAAIAHNLTRAAGCLAGLFHATARGATIRGHLIGVAARISRHGRGEITLHLPEGWHREQDRMNLFETACGPPARAARPPGTGDGAPPRPHRPPVPYPRPGITTRQAAQQGERRECHTRKPNQDHHGATTAAKRSASLKRWIQAQLSRRVPGTRRPTRGPAPGPTGRQSTSSHCDEHGQLCSVPVP